MVGYWRVGSVLFRSWLAGSERTKQRRVFRRCIRPLRAAGISHAFEVITTVKSDKVYRCVCCRRAACCSGHAIPRHGVSCALFSDAPQWSSRFSATDDEDRDDWIMAIEKAQQSSNIDVAANSVSPARFIAQHLHRPCDPAIRQPCDPVC